MSYIAFNRIKLWLTCTTAYRESNYIFSPINASKALNILGKYGTYSLKHVASQRTPITYALT